MVQHSQNAAGSQGYSGKPDPSRGLISRYISTFTYLKRTALSLSQLHLLAQFYMSIFSFNYRDISSQLAVTNQPQAKLDLGSLDFKQLIPFHEKSRQASLDNSHHEQNRHCEHGQPSFSGHHNCHNFRLKHLLVPAILALVALGGLLAWSCVNGHGLSNWGLDNLLRRAFDDTSSTSGSIFTRNKRQPLHSHMTIQSHSSPQFGLSS